MLLWRFRKYSPKTEHSQENVLLLEVLIQRYCTDLLHFSRSEATTTKELARRRRFYNIWERTKLFCGSFERGILQTRNFSRFPYSAGSTDDFAERFWREDAERNWTSEKLAANAKSDQKIYEENVKTILESREVAKKDKGRIMAALSNYAKFERIRVFLMWFRSSVWYIKSEEMTNKIKDLLAMLSEIFFLRKRFQ